LVTGIPALATIARDSYSKKRIGGAGAYKKSAPALASVLTLHYAPVFRMQDVSPAAFVRFR
jgi:hypothetical protein